MSSYQGGPRKTGGGWSKQQQGNRRPNNYWQSSSSSSANASQKFGLREGQTGLFFTIDGDPARAIREARRLLDEFIVDKNVTQIQIGKQQDAAGPEPEIVTAKEVKDKSPSPSKEVGSGGSGSVTADIADSLTEACSGGGTNSGRGGCERRWPNDKWRKMDSELTLTETGVKGTMFFVGPALIGPKNVYSLATTIVDACQKESRARFLARLIPIEKIVRAYEEFPDDLDAYVSAKLGEHLALLDAGSAKPPTYAVDFMHNNSTMVERQKVYDTVATVFTRLSPGSAVSLTGPTLLFIIRVIRSVVLLSCVDGGAYYSARRFSLRPPPSNEAEESVDGKKEKEKGGDAADFGGSTKEGTEKKEEESQRETEVGEEEEEAQQDSGGEAAAPDGKKA